MSSDANAESLKKLRIDVTIKTHNDSEYDLHLKQVVRILSDYSHTDLTLIDLDGLDPFLDTLPCLYVLSAKQGSALRKGKGWPESWHPGGSTWRHLIQFLSQCNPLEIRYAGTLWRQMVEMLLFTAQLATAEAETHQILAHVAAALLRMDPSLSTFTTLHTALLDACVQSRNARVALMVLEKDISSLPLQDYVDYEDVHLCSQNQSSNDFLTQKSGLIDKPTVSDVERYYFYGALTYTGIGNWQRARHFLEFVLLTPTHNVASALMVEAYQKWVLVHLLAKNAEGEVPKLVNSQALKTIKAAAKPYEALASAFKLENSQKLVAERAAGQKRWHSDGNVALVDQVMNHHRNLYVQKIAKVYAAMLLEVISEQLGMSTADTTGYLTHLINSGLLQARIETAGDKTIVTFLSSASGTALQSDEQLRDELLARTKRIKVLQQHVEENDRRLEMSKEYVEHVRLRRKNKDKGRAAEEEGMEMSFGPPASDDEDMTGDTAERV